MAKAILDIFIEASYPYQFNLNLNESDGVDLETDYDCYFYCDSIGELQFSVANDRYELTISEINTAKLLTNLEEYSTYTIKKRDSSYSKLLSGRIHVDDNVRA